MIGARARTFWTFILEIVGFAVGVVIASFIWEFLFG